MLGMPRHHQGQYLGALLVHLDVDTIASLRRAGLYHAPVLDLGASQRLAA